MWVTLQSTASCGACGTHTAVNAVVEALDCDGCGAAVALRPSLWRTVLDEIAERAADLSPNARASTVVEQAGSTLRFELSRAAPRCPHCEADWSAEAPEEGFACPECGEGGQVRRPPVDARHVAWLAAEDRMLTRPSGQAETLACPSCAAPLHVDGSARRVACRACTSEVVLPDEVWRRLHAPTAAARWLIWLSGAQAATELDLTLREVVAGPDGVLFGLASHGESLWCLVACDTDPMRLRWMVDLEALGLDAFDQITIAQIPIRASGPARQAVREVLLHGDADRARIERFDPADGRHLGSIPTPTRGTLGVAADPDGTLLVEVHPSSELCRVDASGRAQPLWPRPGCLGFLFGGHKAMFARPVARPGNTMPGATRFTTGRDGHLRIALMGAIGCLDRSGNLRWSTELPGASIPMCCPTAAPDGTTWGVFLADDTAVLYRVDADGQNPVAVPLEVDGATCVSADEQGHLVIASQSEIRRVDREGRVLWRWQSR